MLFLFWTNLASRGSEVEQIAGGGVKDDRPSGHATKASDFFLLARKREDDEFIELLPFVLEMFEDDLI